MVKGSIRSKEMLLNRPLIESPSHKCVVVLDRSPKFATSIAATISTQVKDEQSQTTLTGALQRTWWDASVEAVLEYHRVVGDLFPRGSKLLRLVVSDFVGRFLTPRWLEGLISYEQLLRELGGCDVPQGGGDAASCSILNGLSIGVEALSETSPAQQGAVALLARAAKVADPAAPAGPWAGSRELGRQLEDYVRHCEGTARPSECGAEEPNSALDDPWRRWELRNRGTLVVLTSLEKAEVHFAAICEHVLEQITARNESMRGVEGQLEGLYFVDQVQLYVLNFTTSAPGGWITTPAALNKSPLLNPHLVNIASVESLLIPSVHRILHSVYDLVSTTVSGIPMKEEVGQGQGQSVNYDVELFHPRGAHRDLEAHGFLSSDYQVFDQETPYRVYPTVRLKWCTVTTKTRSDKFPLLQGSFPMTPASVNSRPSVCLTQFVQGGKCVMLEVNRDKALNRGLQKSTASIIPIRTEDIIASAVGPNLQQKLISHFMVRDEVTGMLVLQCVAMGRRTLLPQPNATSAQKWKLPDFNFAAMRQLMAAAALIAIPQWSKDQSGGLRKAGTTCRNDPTYQKQVETIKKFTFHLPKMTRDSIVYRVHEKFDPLLAIISKWAISNPEWEQCRQMILSFKPNNVELQAALKAMQGGKVASTTATEERFRAAMEELVKVMNNYSHLSPRHAQLTRILCESTNLPLPTPPSGSQTSMTASQRQVPGVKRLAPPQPGMAAPEPKKPRVRITLFDVCLRDYERERLRNWKDFDGRLKWGDQAQAHLYPDLKLPDPGERADRGVYRGGGGHRRGGGGGGRILE